MNLLGWTPGPRIAKLAPYAAGGIIALGIVFGIGACGFQFARGLYLPRAERAEHELQMFTAVQAQLAESMKKEAKRQQEDAEREAKARQNAILAALQASKRDLVHELDAMNLVFQESLNAPQYDCIRNEPLPADTLRLLSRPGGSITP